MLGAYSQGHVERLYPHVAKSFGEAHGPKWFAELQREVGTLQMPASPDRVKAFLEIDEAMGSFPISLNYETVIMIDDPDRYDRLVMIEQMTPAALQKMEDAALAIEMGKDAAEARAFEPTEEDREARAKKLQEQRDEL